MYVDDRRFYINCCLLWTKSFGAKEPEIHKIFLRTELLSGAAASAVALFVQHAYREDGECCCACSKVTEVCIEIVR